MQNHAVEQSHYPVPYQEAVAPKRPLISLEGFLGSSALMTLMCCIPLLFFSLLMVVSGSRGETEAGLVMLVMSGFGSLVGFGMMKVSSNLSYKKKMIETHSTNSPVALLTHAPAAQGTNNPTNFEHRVPTLADVAKQNQGVLMIPTVAAQLGISHGEAQRQLDNLVHIGHARCDLDDYGHFIYTLIQYAAQPKQRRPAPRRQPNLNGTDGSIS